MDVAVRGQQECCRTLESWSPARATAATAHRLGAVQHSDINIRAAMILFVMRVPDSFSLTCDPAKLCDLDHVVA